MLEQNEVATRREVAVLVEDAVVREEALAVHRLDLAGRADVAGVVEIAVEVRRTDENGRASCLPGDLLDRLLGRADEAGPKEQILRGIARHRQLGEDHEICGAILRLGQSLEDQCAVSLEVADDRIDLGQCEPHGLSLAVCASQSKTNAQPPQRRWPNCITQSATPSRPNMWPLS